MNEGQLPVVNSLCKHMHCVRHIQLTLVSKNSLLAGSSCIATVNTVNTN